MFSFGVPRSSWFAVAARWLIIEEPRHRRGGHTTTRESQSGTETGEPVPSEEASSDDNTFFVARFYLVVWCCVVRGTHFRDLCFEPLYIPLGHLYFVFCTWAHINLFNLQPTSDTMTQPGASL